MTSVIYYRISDGGYKKEKPSYINNKNCFYSFVKNFGCCDSIVLVADNVSDDTWEWCIAIHAKFKLQRVVRTHEGSSAGGFRFCFGMALQLPDDTFVLFVENDYLFVPNSYNLLLEGMHTSADYISPYLHPDKFIPASQGGNWSVDDDGGQITKVYKTNNRFWMLVDSTTMTFGAKASTLKRDSDIISKHILGEYPTDCAMFNELRENNRSLIQPIPTLATHGELKWLASTIGLEINSWKELL